MNERLSNMANRTSRTPKKEEAFFDALRDGRSISAACLEAGITRSSAYLWRESDPQFKAKWNECVEEGTDRLEDEAIRRARDGTEKPVYQGGVLVGTTREYSDTLLIFMLKARRPQKFRDRVALGGDAEAPAIRHEQASAREILEGRLAAIAARHSDAGKEPA